MVFCLGDTDPRVTGYLLSEKTLFAASSFNWHKITVSDDYLNWDR